MQYVRLVASLAALCIGLFATVKLPALDQELRRASETTRAFIVRVLTPARAHDEPIDPAAAAKVDEDLDWRIAEGAKTERGYRQFLAAHPNGAHAPLAQAELDKLGPPPQPTPSPLPSSKPAPPPPPSPKPAPPAVAVFSPVVQVINAPPEAPPDIFAALERPPAPKTKIIETTVVKWRAETQHVRVAHERRQHYRPRSAPWPFMAWFGPRAPGSH
jgi:hypothetical protein